jgi:mannosyl-3-phosphoglycerate phosphatase
LRQTSAVVFCAIDSIVPVRGKSLAGFEEFGAKLDHTGLPIVWVTSRSRAQMDEPRRRFGHQHPFIGEDGCGVYLPEDYFHLRPAKTVRMGRFTCIPVAETEPAASEALESLSEETGVSVVPLRSLAPRELEQNTGLPTREAELARQRDFDELFFFAGASDQDIENFKAAGRTRNIQLRQRGILWSLAIGASVRRCIGELSKLYDRALRSHARSVGIATPGQEADLFAACDRSILLTDPVGDQQASTPRPHRVMELPLRSEDAWEQVLASLASTR